LGLIGLQRDGIGLALSSEMIRPRNSYTRLAIRHRDFEVWFSITSPHSMRFRRQIALQLFRAIKPTAQRLSYLFITHSDAHPLQALNAIRRGVRSLGASADLSKVGVRYRLRRLKVGLTVREVADLAKVDFSQLSRIERGLCEPRLRTQIKLERVLFPKVQSNPISGEGDRGV
jgi:hypothetical protein